MCQPEPRTLRTRNKPAAVKDPRNQIYGNATFNKVSLIKFTFVLAIQNFIIKADFCVAALERSR